MSFVDLPAPHGRLEGLYWKVEQPRAAAVVCHPHPLQGGTMHNHVTYRLADALREKAVSALRFNFRGVGRSTGTYDRGPGEVADAKAALDYLSHHEPGVPLWATGFSFGARTALTLAIQDSRIERAIAVGLPVDSYELDFLRKLRCPVAFIQADRDEFGSIASLEALRKTLSAPSQLFVLADSTHLAQGRLEEFSKVAKEAIGWLLST